jgi:hypothetical protein
MKAVSIHQPWAWAILHAGKNVENRTWATRHRGPLLIHASRSRASYNRQDAALWPELYGVELPAWEELTTGAILGIVDVVDCVRVGPAGTLGEGAASVWALEGYFGWVLANPRVFAKPITYRGAQMLFEVNAGLIPTAFRSLPASSHPLPAPARYTRIPQSAGWWPGS